MKNEIIMREGSAWTEAYPILSKVINEKKLKIGAEIGVAYGGHAEYILSNTKLEKLYGVDPYKHIFGYRDPMNFSTLKFNKLCDSMISRLSIFKDRFFLIRKKSKNAVDDIHEKLDFVYIDADHSYNGVKKDISRWFDKVKSNGIISGHDYNHPNFLGVKKAVDEFAKKHNWKLHYDKSGVWWVEKKEIPISFIIPAYNCEETIEESVNSILNGNFMDGDEIIIVNDKATDNTLNIIKGLEKKESSIKVIEHTSNLGGGAARNTAVKNSKNDLIFCLDSDNILEKNSISKLKDELLKNKADVVFFEKILFFNKNKYNINHIWKLKKYDFNLEDLFKSSIVPPSSGNYLFTKESWINANGYPENTGALDTWGFGFKQLLNKQKMIISKNTYYFHRIGHESYWTRDSENNKINSYLNKILEPYMNMLSNNIKNILKNSNWFNEKYDKKIGIVIFPAKNYLLNLFKKIIKKIIYHLKINIKKIINYIKFIFIVKDYFKYKIADRDKRFSLSAADFYPQIRDKTKTTGFDAHYIYHPAWAARIIAKINPKKHVDISSTLNFSTMLSAFIPVEFYDYRPANLKLNNLTSGKADLTSLPFEDSSIESLSCMHTVEHIGLGRYGDPIDPDGDIKAMKELSRVLEKNGNLLFVVPVGKPRIQFNAHRIYSYDQIIKSFSDLTLKEFSLIPDDAINSGIINNANEDEANKQKYGCGCFWFTK